MYIGPWQEYRLAKIQDNAIQRIRQEWEDNIRAQLPDGDDTRIRELMQPLMAKLPALLMAKKTDAGDTTTPPGTRMARRSTPATATRPATAASTASSTRSRTDRAESGKSRQGPSNQDTHEDHAAPAKPRRPLRKQASKTKKKPDGSAVAVQEVERRRKLFATWMKSQQEQSTAVTPTEETPQEESATRLPPLRSNTLTPRDAVDPPPTEATRLPPLTPSVLANPEEPEAPSPREEPNLDDSLDEDEVNQLLNWTDNLLSPSALESSLVGLDDME